MIKKIDHIAFASLVGDGAAVSGAGARKRAMKRKWSTSSREIKKHATPP